LEYEMKPRTPLLEACQLSYRYPGVHADALSELTLSIPAGQKTVICGHNGSGKSTFFLQAIGICRPQSGELRWQGTPVSYSRGDLKQLRQQIGLVFQDPEQQLILGTPYEDISYGLRNAGLPEEEINRRTEAMLTAMSLEHLAGVPLHHLSLGQKKRVALAGVLALEPLLLLLDEPTAYLDRVSERQLTAELDRIHRSGITTVMATHDMNLAYAWADRILVLDHGKCVLEGSPYEVFSHGELLLELGLELPLMLELWLTLPESVRKNRMPPRSIEEFKLQLADLTASAAV
jgi:cobalt/nickel transport system ATP-binding protein